MIGIAAFIDATEGYYEFGYGFVNGENEFSDLIITASLQRILNVTEVGYQIVCAQSGRLDKALTPELSGQLMV